MSRVIFPNGQQRIYLEKIIKESSSTIQKIASICDVSERTIRDWRREKFTLSESALIKLQEYFPVDIPPSVEKIPDFLYLVKNAHLGALRRLELYGPPGTLEGRKKGGKISQLNRKLHPELYPNIKKIRDFKFPEKSAELAEFIGIILGDGGISTYQLRITLNEKEESRYIEFVSDLIYKLFGKIPYHYGHKDEIISNVTLGGVALIEFLNSLGLKNGSKVRHQIGVPEWIYNNENYARACLRGLIDTDGGVFYHHHIVQNIKCFNIGLCFGNHSQPLLDFVYTSLLALGFNPKKKKYTSLVQN